MISQPNTSALPDDSGRRRRVRPIFAIGRFDDSDGDEAAKSDNEKDSDGFGNVIGMSVEQAWSKLQSYSNPRRGEVGKGLSASLASMHQLSTEKVLLTLMSLSLIHI